MSEYEIKLLKHAILQEQETADARIKLQPRNLTEIDHFTNAASVLVEKGLIFALSDNIDADTILIVPNGTIIEYALTDSGRREASRL